MVKKAIKHYSFALTEVCVALAILGILISYVLIGAQRTLVQYQRLYETTMCFQLADEYLATALTGYLTTDLPFEEILVPRDQTFHDDHFIIHLTTDPQTPSEKASKTASLLTVKITVELEKQNPPGPVIERSTKLCIIKGKACETPPHNPG